MLFYYLSGKLAMKTENFIVVDVGGVGYQIVMSTPSISSVGAVGSDIKVYTYVNVKEDAVDIYGFLSAAELTTFELLISVSGVGPKAGLSVLSVLSCADFALAVITDDDKAISAAPGIGPKTAKRIILELKDKMKTQDAVEMVQTPPAAKGGKADARSEAISALMVLGYGNLEARKAVSGVYEDGFSVEELIKRALKALSQ